ncbi:uncharacterized protein Z519_04680 [Cladophialophora bantiana CBS 173.52]|uniref:Uncharacterized protein n=1 Tax=Cladophialophora bantiana (strain ATCC 10958 / CBS 173.52 / CDC B-1940 / NIH 8579) TaxID=1442370 RepID=A0A0D2HMU9_CLAB1|nr:uncharacterized protein Z519_04680 [Cladophialophora bantiana CBS 173.52]KIW94703.1 hypothetical protein Z519_04680 [Cladophialophora bantiana CBS 173.52]
MASDGYCDLGTFTTPITTTSFKAQKWFDQGILWSYGFNHDEAIKCVVYASGPNHNKVWASFDQDDLRQSVATSHGLSREAMRHVAHLTPKEAALCNAIQSRYPSRDIPFDFETSNRSYAEAMRKVYDEFGQEGLNKMFDPHTGQPIVGSPVHEVTKLLEDGLKDPACRKHLGILHLYIHHMEMSANPAVALPAADLLRPLCPDGGHLKHMPSHLDVLVGD